MLKAVIDTNIWISALLKSSLTRPILEAFAAGKFIPVISVKLLKELLDTLSKSEIKKLLHPDESKELIALIDEKSVKREPTIEVNACRDPEDNFILALSKASQAPLVTLDKDLLVLSKEFNIISPKEFLQLLNK